MVIKGGSRAAPKELAFHLGRTDTNERVEILELRSPARSTAEAFEDWQLLSEGTAQGKLGLYHANIDPEAKYAMTPDQWQQSADVLEEELGLTGQPRAIVLHEKGGRSHVHVVWQRTDIDSMTLRDDGYNYAAHERASLRLEIAFGHDHVPGKHAKRDRNRQQQMPDAALDHGEWQQAQRGGLDHQARKAQATALYQAADCGAAFKAALEDAGYIVVRGDRTDYALLDAEGKIYSLARQLPGVDTKTLRTFMVDVDPAHLPSAAEARAEQRAQAAQVPPTNEQDADPARAEALRAAILARQAEELQAQEMRHGAEISALQERQLRLYDEAIDKLVRAQARATIAARPGDPGFAEQVREKILPAARAARLEQEAESARELAKAQHDEMQAMHAAMQDTHKAELHDLVMKQAKELDDLMVAQERDLARRLEDDARAAALARELQRREEVRDREGPERDDRAR